MDKRLDVSNALADWVIHVTAKKGLATPEEIAALPEVAEVFFRYYSSVSFSPVRKENTSSIK